MSAGDITERQHLVKAARQLERAMAQRRKTLKRLAELDDTIRQCRKLVRDLTMPMPPSPEDVYRPLDDDDAEGGTA